MRLSILIFCFFHGTCMTSHQCVYQPKTLYVKEGESVTIPCSYTYPDYKKNLKEKFIITWGKTDGLSCRDIKKNITDSSGYITDEYRDRVSAVHHSDNRTASITIQGLKAADGITFCCTMTILTNVSTPFIARDWFGTSLAYPDRRSVTQAEELIAVPGEEMIIPCHYPLETLGEALQVTWYSGYGELCALKNNEIHTWTSAHRHDGFSLVNFPEDVSLRIHNDSKYDFFRYCCRVTTSNGTIESRRGTELTFLDSLTFPPIRITQTQKMAGHIEEIVTLNCSYNLSEDNVLWVNTYWRLGNISGPYVYHPYKEMVHSSYRGRTEITGPADLHIRGLQMSDDSIYYCFVVLRLCSGNNIYIKSVKYGEGTRLSVAGAESQKSTDRPDDHSKKRLVITVSISASMLLILLCVTLVVLRTAGVICKKKTVPAETSDNPENEHKEAAECKEEA